MSGLNTAVDRRTVFTALAAGAAALVLPLPMWAAAPTASAAARPDAWLRIGPDGVITIIVSQAEMGQGVHTALPMIVAEELDADWRRIRVEPAPVAPVYRSPTLNHQSTGASLSVRDFYPILRQTGAAARAMLVDAAAAQWGVAAASLHTQSGRVIDPESGRVADYGELAVAAARLPVPPDPPHRDPATYRLVGKSIPRLDIPGKVDGSARFGIDVDLPGMLIATIAAAPVFGGTYAGGTTDASLAVRGVRAVVPLDTAVAVVADGYWQARKGLEALAPTWSSPSEASAETTDTLADHVRRGLDQPGARIVDIGDVVSVGAQSTRRVSARYEVPYLYHATMEPMNATARVTASECEVWAPTQSAEPARDAAARACGLPPDAVTVHTTLMGGGFGRRTRSDFVAQAVAAAKAVGQPVKLIWSREEDVQHGTYRPAAAAAFDADLDPDGAPIAWTHRLAAPSILADWGVTTGENDPLMSRGAANLPYSVPNQRLDYVPRNRHVPIGVWRSVGRSHNRFFVESFIDELAHAAGADPYDYRRRLLAGEPRIRRALDTTADKIGWGTNNRHAYGIALDDGYESVNAQAIELTVAEDKTVTIHRIVCAIDCGTVINPDTVVAQVEGGILYGLSAAMREQVTVAGGRVAESNFHDYPVLLMAEAPPIDVFLIPDGSSPGGVGEAATPPIAPALTNAIFAATGERLRSLPLTRHGYDFG